MSVTSYEIDVAEEVVIAEHFRNETEITNRLRPHSRQIYSLSSASSSTKVQSSMVEYHTLVAYGHVMWLSGRSNH